MRQPVQLTLDCAAVHMVWVTILRDTPALITSTTEWLLSTLTQLELQELQFRLDIPGFCSPDEFEYRCRTSFESTECVSDQNLISG